MATQEALCWLGVRSALFFSGCSRSGNTLKKKSWVNQGYHIALLGTDVFKGISEPRGSKLLAHLQQDKTVLLNASSSLHRQDT